MPDSPFVARIAELLREHRQRDEWGIPADECSCGWPSSKADYLLDWPAHIAGLVASLHTQEWGVQYEGESLPDEVTDDPNHAQELAAERCTSCDHCRNAMDKQVVSRFVSAWEES